MVNWNWDYILRTIMAIPTVFIPVRYIYNRVKRFKGYKQLTRNTVSQLKNYNAFPWIEDYTQVQSLNKFYVKKLNITDNNSKKSSPISIIRNNVIYLGNPGSGKSTFLKHLYLAQVSGIKEHLNTFFGRQFYYFSASEVVENCDKLYYYISENHYNFHLFYFIDGLDEVSIHDTGILVNRLLEFQLKNVTLVLTCRKEEYNLLMKTNMDFSKLGCKVYLIGDWGDNQIDDFIKKYSMISKCDSFKTRIQIYRDDQSFSGFFRTPLDIALLSFIVENSNNNEHLNKMSHYELYSNFIKKWIIRECVREKIDYYNNHIVEKTFALLSEISYRLYKDVETCPNDKIITKYFPESVELDKFLYGLLQFREDEDDLYISGFYHLRFKEFFMAYYFCESLKLISNSLINSLSIRYNHSVSAFIKNRFMMYSEREIYVIIENLLSLLVCVCNIDKKQKSYKIKKLPKEINKTIKDINPETRITICNEICYFIARIPIYDSPQKESLISILKNAYSMKLDIRVKRTIAISAAILGVEDLELKYAKELLNDEESNLVDRSFTLVYYQDVPHSNPFTYCDDGKTQWTMSREARIHRLKSEDEKSQRMRTFDLITILNFLKSREKSCLLTEKEISTIRECDIDCMIYSEKKKQFLQEIKLTLLKQIDKPMS